MTTANPGRVLLRDTFQTAQPAWNVIAAPRQPDALARDTALIWTANLTRTGYAGGEYVSSTVELWLLPAKQDSPTFEDAADAMLTDALQTIEDTDGITWTTAEREQLEQTWHGWHLTLTISHHLTKED